MMYTLHILSRENIQACQLQKKSESDQAPAIPTEFITLNELHTYEIDPTPLLDLAVLDEAELMVDPAGSTQSL